MAKGYGVQVSDWVLVGLLAVGGYFAYKMLVKPVSDVTGSAGATTGQIIDSTGNLITGYENVWTQLLGKIGQGIGAIGGNKTTSGAGYYIAGLEQTFDGGKGGFTATINQPGKTTYLGTYSAPIMTTKNNPLQVGVTSKGYNTFALQSLAYNAQVMKKQGTFYQDYLVRKAMNG